MSGTSLAEPVIVLGSPASPYTRKFIAALRYQRIPYQFRIDPALDCEGLEKPKVPLLPTVYFSNPDGPRAAAVDSTDLLLALEPAAPERSLYPSDPALRYLALLLEDYGDEWLTKAMFHYRWVYEADIANAADYLFYVNLPGASAADAETMGGVFARRQIDRLYVVGSNQTTGETIETSYRRLLGRLNEALQPGGYLFGARPSVADYGLYGQLTQLTRVDPTPAAIAAKEAPRIVAWVDAIDDLSGLEPAAGDWLAFDAAARSLKPLLEEVGRTYAPFLVANAAALAAGEEMVAEIDGRPWRQPAFKYQGKCLIRLREAFAALDAEAQDRLRPLLQETGCGALTA